MFLKLVGNIFASREANFVSATNNVSTGGQTWKHRESQMFPQQCFQPRTQGICSWELNTLVWSGHVTRGFCVKWRIVY